MQSKILTKQLSTSMRTGRYFLQHSIRANVCAIVCGNLPIVQHNLGTKTNTAESEEYELAGGIYASGFCRGVEDYCDTLQTAMAVMLIPVRSWQRCRERTAADNLTSDPLRM